MVIPEMPSVSKSDALRTYPELAEVVTLRDAGWQFLPLHEAGELIGFAGLRRSGESTIDVLQVFDRHDCRAARLVMDAPDAPGGIVWRFDGGLTEAVQELRSLPAPDEPGAPKLIVRRGSLLQW